MGWKVFWIRNGSGIEHEVDGAVYATLSEAHQAAIALQRQRREQEHFDVWYGVKPA